MSVNRCIYLLSRCHIRYRVCASTSFSTATVANNTSLHPTKRTSEELSRRHSSSDSSSRPLDTSLFVPLTVKSDEAWDGAIGAELTQPLDKSMLLVYYIIALAGYISSEKPLCSGLVFL